MRKTVLAMYNSLEEGRNVVLDLLESGSTHDSVSLVMADKSGEIQHYFENQVEKGKTGVEAEVTPMGALARGLSGRMKGMTMIKVPGIGSVLASGQLAAAMAPAAAGITAPTLSSALVSTGLSESEAEMYVIEVVRGGTLVAVHTQEEDAEHALTILNRHNPLDVESDTRQFVSSTTQPMGSFETGAPLVADNLSTHEIRTAMPSTVSVPEKEEEGFRSHFMENYSDLRTAYEDYRPSYEYGYTLAFEDRFRNRDWESFLPQARYQWEAMHPEKPWAQYEKAIHAAWVRATNG